MSSKAVGRFWTISPLNASLLCVKLRLSKASELMGRDMEMGGDIFTIETSFETMHVFWSR
ncbi:MAG: hypothetical protein NTAFB09_22270 [Nitrosospira sp.]